MKSNKLSREEILLTLGPFILFPLLFLLAVLITPIVKTPVNPLFAVSISLAIIGSFLIAMLIGWVKNFPRWVFPYWGFIVLVTIYVYNFTGTMAGYQVRGDWWAWMPIVSVIVIGSFWARSIQPTQALFKSIWKDWTLLSFALFGALPLIFLFAYDEVRNEEPVFTAIMLILAGGAVFYLRAENIWDRFIRLESSFTLGWIILMVHQAIYWDGRQELGMREPGSWITTLSRTSRFGAFLMLVLSAPALIGLLRWIIEKRRSPKTAI